MKFPKNSSLSAVYEGGQNFNTVTNFSFSSHLAAIYNWLSIVYEKELQNYINGGQ